MMFLIIGSLIILTSLYYYLTRNFDFFTSRGIDGPKPLPLLGTNYAFFFKSMPELFIEYSKKYGKIYGLFLGSRPILSISDPELIKDINIRDFHKFIDRNDWITGDALQDRSLLNLFGDEWKKMRSIISPTFSSGKMRKMHPILEKCVARLENVLTKKAKEDNNEIELKKVMGNLTMDVIASCAFGTQIDTHNEPNNPFVTNAQKFFRGDWRFWVFFTLKPTFPKLLELLDFKISDPKVTDFFRSAIRSIIARRKTENENQTDFLQLMINSNKKTDKEDIEDEVNEAELYGQSQDSNIIDRKINAEVSEDDILATSLLFFVAGYETTASLLSFLCYSLAVNQDCQQKLYEEVKSIPDFNYDTILKMPYLDACIAETLRLYNPLSATGRVALEDYELGNTGITIPKGLMVNCDIQTIHRNPEYYPNPDNWNPERFLPENRDRLTPYTYMPFGIGPRNCVGMRFALMEAKTAIVHLVDKFKFVTTLNTQTSLKPMKFDILLNCGEIRVGIELRN